MKEKIISEIIREMISSLNNEQLSKLKTTLEIYLYNVSIEAKQEADTEKKEVDYLEVFLSAKRIEGCSEKTLIYYKNTIQQMLDSIGKSVCTIVTEDLRTYLAEYQKEKQSSKVTIDNIRRIFSSFFSWLEDEDYIIKSPVRRIHRIKAASTIKETYTDEQLESMRDNCDNPRDLALIDILASTGMRVGELVLLNRDDISFVVNGVDIRKFGSQGQQRTAALSLKLSEIELVKRLIGDTPVLLLDDVLSELDKHRQNYLLDSIHDIQTLITCTGLDEFVNHRFSINKVFHVQNGHVSKEN